MNSFEIRALANFPQMYMWIHDIAKKSSTSFKQRLCMAEKNVFDIKKKKFFQIMCVTVLQGTSTRLHMQMNGVPLPATMFYVS